MDDGLYKRRVAILESLPKSADIVAPGIGFIIIIRGAGGVVESGQSVQLYRYRNLDIVVILSGRRGRSRRMLFS